MDMEFSPRMRQILLIMLREDRTISVKYLAEQMNLSRRTVQRELEYLGRPLKKYGLEFCSKTGTGIWIEGGEQDKKALLGTLTEEDVLDVSDRTERRKRLVLEILKDKKLKKLFYYSDLFGVSEATVSADLEAAEGWLSRFGLEIRRKPGYGISMEGREQDFRRALRAFLDENLDSQIIREVYDDRNQPLLELVENDSDKNVYRLLNDDILKRVIACMARMKDRRIRNLTENSYVGLVLHIAIAVNRILKREFIEENEGISAALKEDEDYRLAGDIIRELEREFSVEIPKSEIGYVCLHLKGAKVQQLELDDESRESVVDQRELMEVVSEMVDRFDRKLSCLLKQDEEFVIQGLAAHLRPTLVRLENGLRIENPLLEQIKTDYADIYRRCVDVAGVIEEHYGFPVPEPEIGYLAIHFGAALVRLENRSEVKRRVDVGVVCASGIGISRFMASRIERAFGERISLKTYSAAELTPYVIDNTDFLVSTLNLREEADIVQVSPLLTKRDMDEIGARVRRYERLPAREKKDDPFTRQLEQINYMAAQIRALIKGFHMYMAGEQISFEELLVAVSETQSPYGDRRQMIMEDIRKRERMGSQFFPEFGFALLHARTQGAARPSFSLWVTRGRGPFESPEMKKISAAVIMLLPDDEHAEENSQMLGYLSERMIEEPEFLDAMKNGGEEEVRELLSRYLKQFFNTYLDRV